MILYLLETYETDLLVFGSEVCYKVKCYISKEPDQLTKGIVRTHKVENTTWPGNYHISLNQLPSGSAIATCTKK